MWKERKREIEFIRFQEESEREKDFRKREREREFGDRT